MIGALLFIILLPIALVAIGFTAFWTYVLFETVRIKKRMDKESKENLI